MVNCIHIVGFGSQGAAWAENLRDSGWMVEVYLKDETSRSWPLATDLGFHPRPLSALAPALSTIGGENLIAFLCPDDIIGGLYRDYLAPLPLRLSLILAHGYAVYAGDLKPLNPEHRVRLLAPKAIGPELRRARVEHKTHSLKAAITPHSPEIAALAIGLGFAAENLIECAPEVEAVGDLISEQMLLCGGLFTLTAWTMEEMKKAGVPDALIHEECITELGLIARLMKERGVAGCASKISRAAAAGAALTSDALVQSGARAALAERAARVKDRRFADEYRRGEWRESLKRLETALTDAEKKS